MKNLGEIKGSFNSYLRLTQNDTGGGATAGDGLYNWCGRAITCLVTLKCGYANTGSAGTIEHWLQLFAGDPAIGITGFTGATYRAHERRAIGGSGTNEGVVYVSSSTVIEIPANTSIFPCAFALGGPVNSGGTGGLNAIGTATMCVKIL